MLKNSTKLCWGQRLAGSQLNRILRSVGRRRKLSAEKPSDLSEKVSKDSPTGTDKMKMDKNKIGIQCSIEMRKVEHHVVIETVKSCSDHTTTLSILSP